MQLRQLAAALAVTASLSGCASVMEGTTQPIAIITTPEPGATCVVSNDRGTWTTLSPGTVTVDKSESVLKIVCSKPGRQDGTLYAAGRMSSAGMVGMMLPYVGLLDTAVDAGSGAMLKYPDSFTIDLKPAAATAAASPVTPAPPAH